MPAETPEQFRTARLSRKRRVRWWRSHVPLAYAVVTTIFAMTYVVAMLVDRNAEHWLRSIGLTPAELNLVFGVAYCTLGIWGLKRGHKGIGWAVLYGLCLASGILSFVKVLSF